MSGSEWRILNFKLQRVLKFKDRSTTTIGKLIVRIQKSLLVHLSSPGYSWALCTSISTLWCSPRVQINSEYVEYSFGTKWLAGNCRVFINNSSCTLLDNLPIFAYRIWTEVSHLHFCHPFLNICYEPISRFHLKKADNECPKHPKKLSKLEGRYDAFFWNLTPFKYPYQRNEVLHILYSKNTDSRRYNSVIRYWGPKELFNSYMLASRLPGKRLVCIP